MAMRTSILSLLSLLEKEINHDVSALLYSLLPLQLLELDEPLADQLKLLESHLL